MQHQTYSDRPLVWHEVPAERFSRNARTYRARSTKRESDSFEKRAYDRAHFVRAYSGQADLLTRLLPGILLALATIFIAIAAFCALTNDSPSAQADPARVQEQVKSTARDQWTRGKMPYLYQTDKEWGGTAYAGGSVADSGCGPTCMSMVYVYLTGKKDRDPAQMSAFIERNGYIDCGMTSWMFMSDGARRLGLSSRDLPADEGIIRNELDAGHPIIVSVSEGDFTTKGHFIVLAGTDAFGRILVRDPNSPERSAQAWDLSRILAQTRNLWAFSL